MLAIAAIPNLANANSDAGWWQGGWKHKPSRYLTLWLVKRVGGRTRFRAAGVKQSG
jgi:hypothetical protein